MSEALLAGLGSDSIAQGRKGGVRVPALGRHPAGRLGEAAPSSRFGDIWRGIASVSTSLPHVTVLGDEVTGLLVLTMLLCWIGILV